MLSFDRQLFLWPRCLRHISCVYLVNTRNIFCFCFTPLAERDLSYCLYLCRRRRNIAFPALISYILYLSLKREVFRSSLFSSTLVHTSQRTQSTRIIKLNRINVRRFSCVVHFCPILTEVGMCRQNLF